MPGMAYYRTYNNENNDHEEQKIDDIKLSIH